MKRDFLYTTFSQVEPPAGLYGRIMLRIAGLERRAARLRAAAFSLLSLLSLAALVPALQYAAQQFAASGFYQYFSLLFSDSSLALAYWREFSLSLIESLPSLAILLLIALGLLLWWSVRRTARSARIAFA